MKTGKKDVEELYLELERERAAGRILLLTQDVLPLALKLGLPVWKWL